MSFHLFKIGEFMDINESKVEQYMNTLFLLKRDKEELSNVILGYMIDCQTKDKRINELEEFNLVLANENHTLKEEFMSWIIQKGCDCGHPSCSNCEDTKYALKLLDK